MKKLILLAFLSVTIVSACRKEKKEKTGDRPVKEAIKRVWFTTSEKYEYYDASNNKVFETTTPPGSRYLVEAEKVKKSNPAGQQEFYVSYALSTSGDKNYITFTANGKTQTYLVDSIVGDKMIWIQEIANPTYQENGTTKTATKVVITFEFHCPCEL